MIKAIIFDIGEVLQLDPKGERYEKFALAVRINPIEFRKFIASKGKYMAVGKISAKEFCAAAKEKFKIAAPIEKIISAWKKVYMEEPLNLELFELIKKLKNNYKIAALSDAHEASVEGRRTEMFLSSFDEMIFSNEHGIAKPDKGIFEITIKKLGLLPDDCIFIDDKEIHVKAANALGFHAILFKSNSQLIKELKSLGVKF